jgi:Flp pilus assembly protein protease CpaA
MSPFGIGLATFVTLAMIYDLRERRIPNVLVLVGGIFGLAIGAAHGGGTGLADAGLGMIGAGGILFPAFALGWLGAGDVKLAGALGAWLGLAAVPLFLAATLVAGSLVSAAVIAVDLVRRRRRERDERGSRFGEVPYALAVGAGAIVAFATLGAP